MEIDASNMKQVIKDSPQQLVKGLALAEDIGREGAFKNIIVCGMGGSALPADILRSQNVQIYVHRDYGLPATATTDSLIICISYSGNTEETLSALEEAIEKKMNIIGIASGGAIEALCQKNNIPFVKIPSGIQPRSASGYIVAALVKVLENSGFNKNISSELSSVATELEKINTILEEEGKTLAKKLAGKIPVVYAANNLWALSVARIWKIKFNENSKIPAFYNYFPELNHNEMVGYTNAKKDFFVIMLKDSTTHTRTQKRMELTATMLSEKGIGVEIITMKEGSSLFKVFSTLLLGDWVSYYLALENNVDPTPVAMVEEFKKQMQ